MSESNGGAGDTAVMERTTAHHQLELHLKFKSRDYTLPQLRSRLEDVEALLVLLLADKSMLPLSSSKSSIGERMQAELDQAELLRGVVVEKVSLSSPLEIVAIITATASATAAVIKIMPKIIAIKNEWNDSRVKRAESNLRIDRIMLERKLVKVIADETDKLSEAEYQKASQKNATKKLVKAAALALSQLDIAETKD